MEVAGEYTFDASQDLVWEALHDPNVLGSVMPGGQAFETVGEYEYAGSMKIKVGPVQGVFKAEIKLSDVVPPESYSIAVQGTGGPGFVSATGSMKLGAVDDSQTHMEYAGDARVGGKIASVGQRLIDSTARSIIAHSLEGLNEYLKVQAAQQKANTSSAESGSDAAPQEFVAAYKPPTEAEMAIKVSQDVMKDMLPPAMRVVIAIAVIAIVAFIIWQIVT